MAELIRLSSRALGEKVRVRVYIYDTLDEMRAAGTRFNGNEHSDAAGLTQAYANRDDTSCLPIIRLARTHLDSTYVSHEMHHAATALWGAHVRATGCDAGLTHYNEEFAYLFSDLYGRLIAALWARGIYK